MSTPYAHSQPDSDDDIVSSPQRPLASSSGAGGGENESHPISAHSRSTSHSALSELSPPVSPRNNHFAAPVNPFATPSTLHNFASTEFSAVPSNMRDYFMDSNTPRSGGTSVSASVADLSRVSSHYGSRPTTAGEHQQSFAPPGPGTPRMAFTSPPARPMTIYSTVAPVKIKRERPKSTMLTSESDVQKPWITTRDPASRIAYFLTYGFMLLGIAASVLKGYFDWKSIPVMKGNLCPVMDEEFDSDEGIFGENGKFFQEVDMSGFGNGQFEMTTNSLNNSFVSNGRLYILPTLTSDSIPMDAILDGHVYNITDCTFNITRGVSYTESSGREAQGYNQTAIGSDADFDAEGYYRACSAVSNSTTGQIINPIQSARISTRTSASIRYGKVEVRARIPTGDWMWPAIWMLPVDNTYGGWPLSGEIDIMESRGNGPSYPKQGTNYVRGSLNWGPLTWLNAVHKTYGWWYMRRGSYDTDFHTYTLEWTEEFIRIYVDTRLHHTLQLKLNQPFWDRGDFPPVVQNGSDAIVLQNPWVNGTKAAPFDQRFYLIMNLAVGGTNGWFPDGDEKPWLDGSATAMRDFLNAKDQWYPTWPENLDHRAFVIDSVKMWQQC